jgi:hypothetical protein
VVVEEEEEDGCKLGGGGILLEMGKLNRVVVSLSPR